MNKRWKRWMDPSFSKTKLLHPSTGSIFTTSYTWRNPEGLIKQTQTEPCFFFFRFDPAVHLLDHSGHRLCKDQTLQHWTLGATNNKGHPTAGLWYFFYTHPKKNQKKQWAARSWSQNDGDGGVDYPKSTWIWLLGVIFNWVYVFFLKVMSDVWRIRSHGMYLHCSTTIWENICWFTLFQASFLKSKSKKHVQRLEWYCWWFRNPKQPPGMYI